MKKSNYISLKKATYINNVIATLDRRELERKQLYQVKFKRDSEKNSYASTIYFIKLSRPVALRLKLFDCANTPTAKKLLKMSKRKNKKQFKYHYDLLMNNLFLAAYYGKSLSIALHAGYFKKDHKLTGLNLEYLNLLIDFLEEKGFIAVEKGMYDINKQTAWRTKLSPTAKLLTQFPEHKTIAENFIKRKQSVKVKEESNFIRIKCENPGDIRPLSDTEYKVKEKQEQFLRKYNKWLIRHKVEYTDEGGVTRTFFCFTSRVYRNNLKTGGRFYCTGGVGWQNIKKDLRKSIRIDGEESIELDFQSMHPTMLYHAEEKPAPNDIYTIPGIPDKYRPLIKIMMLIMLNAKSRKNAIGAFEKSVLDNEKLKGLYNDACKNNFSALVLNKHIRKAHKPIKRHFYQKAWRTLQKEDSDIMQEILKTCCKEKILALPVHDSIIVPKQHTARCKQIMEETYLKHMGFPIRVTQK